MSQQTEQRRKENREFAIAVSKGFAGFLLLACIIALVVSLAMACIDDHRLFIPLGAIVAGVLSAAIFKVCEEPDGN